MNVFEYVSQLQNRELTSGPGMWEEFQRTSIWQDMLQRLTLDLFERWEALEKEEDHHAAGIIKGNIEAIKRFMDMPSTLAEEALAQIEDDNS